MKRQEDHKNISMISDRDARAKLWLVFERDFASVSDRKLSVGVFISFARWMKPALHSSACSLHAQRLPSPTRVLIKNKQ